MNYKLKSAFSMFELLIVLAIISVITAMFLMVSKKGIENAYNRYYYASYKAISDAISYSNDRNTDISKRNSLDYFWIGQAFGFDKDENGNSLKTYTSDDVTYPKTSNGVIFKIQKILSENTPPRYRYMITATLPSADNTDTAQLEAIYTYFPDVNNGILIPRTAKLPSGGEIALYERKDLLPFYVDEGENGRNVTYLSKNSLNKVIIRKGSYTKRVYDNFINTYCKIDRTDQNGEVEDRVLIYLNKESSCPSNGSVKGYVKVANPQKAL